MNITSDKVVSNSQEQLKMLKKTEGTESPEKIKKSKMSEKLFADFASVSSNDIYIKAKIQNNNTRLSAYEYNVSKSQFIEQKLGDLQILAQNGQTEEAWSLIKESSFDKKPVLMEYFNEGAPLQNQIDFALQSSNRTKQKLDKEFAAIQIASQNLSSISPDVNMINRSNDRPAETTITADAVNTLTFDSKRVMKLII